MSDSLQPHEPQHTRPPCPSPTPGVYSNSCPLSWWCHPTILSSVIPFSSHLQSFPASGSFQMSQLFASGGQSFSFNISPSNEHSGLISLRIFQSLLWSTKIKGFGIVNKAEVDIFLELSCFFDDPVDVGNLISGSSAFSKSNLNIWKFTVHAACWSLAWRILSITLLAWDECNCAVVRSFFGIAFLWDWNGNWPFPVLWSLLHFPNLVALWVLHFHSIIF